MRFTERTKSALAYRRQKRDLESRGYEEIGERGGNLWEIYRGGRMGQKIVDAVVATHGMSVFVKIERPGARSKAA